MDDVEGVDCEVVLRPVPIRGTWLGDADDVTVRQGVHVGDEVLCVDAASEVGDTKRAEAVEMCASVWSSVGGLSSDC